MASVDEAVATTKQIEATPQGLLKRWIAELDVADRAEETWRKEGKRIIQLYESDKQQSSSFNILWSNTETLRPALYNSQPKADVRRRFRDPDPVGKVAAVVEERALDYSMDAYDFDEVIKASILDVLLPGRGVARIKYAPKFRPAPAAPSAANEAPSALPADDTGWLDGGAEPALEPEEEVAGESAECEHVQWDDFRRGPGKKWSEVPWVAFRHRMPFDQLVEMFGEELARRIPLSEVGDESKITDKTIRSMLKTAEIWEVWDKTDRRVIFLCEQFRDGPLKLLADPLELENFFPLPRPIYAIENWTTLIPGPLYEKYEEQARELNDVTRRIRKIVHALKVRGAYASHLSELAKVIEAEDNVMIPVENTSGVNEIGGLDKAIWIMPIDKLVIVLRELYAARKETIQTIYEISGIGDIMRGVSNPHETLGAQQLKSQWGSLRLQRLQRDVQRFIRDLLRLKAEIFAKHFSVETLQVMTGVQLPTKEQKAQLQAMAAQAQATQQEIPPEAEAAGKTILALPTWIEVGELLKSDKMRMYRIDIETDSTVQETLTRDAQGMQEAITAVTNLFAGLGPAIQAGYMSIDVAKTLAQAIARTSRMGQAVEDAVDQMTQPPPPPPEAQPPDHSLEVAQIKTASDEKITQAELQHKQALDGAAKQHAVALEGMKQQTEQAKAAADAQARTAEANAKGMVEQVKEEAKRANALLQDETKKAIAALQTAYTNKTATAVAEINAQAKRDGDLLNAAVKIITAQISATKSADEEAGAIAEAEYAKQEGDTANKALMSTMDKLLKAHMAPKKVVMETDADGNVVGATATPDIGE